ncbi:MAG: hypothetical protein ACFCU7_12845 [Pleurocapsa sp.]
MDDVVFDTADWQFKVNQIVCLEHQSNKLYGEVIQLIPNRKLCWFRPKCLVLSNFDIAQPNDYFYKQSKQPLLNSNSVDLAQKAFCRSSNLEETQLIDLRSTSDLLWPVILFRPAFDTEIIYLLAQLNDPNYCITDKTINRQHLNRFVQQVWQANQDKF